jgi:hypothetical protein
MAKMAGVQPRNIYRTLSSLEEKGYVEVIDKGGGRAKSTRRRIHIAETLAHEARVSAMKNPDECEHEILSNSATSPDANGIETLAPMARGTDHGTSHHGTSPSTDAVVMLLVGAGITVTQAKALADQHPEDYLHKLIDVTDRQDQVERLRNKAGWIIHHARNSTPIDVLRRGLPKSAAEIVAEAGVE